MASTSSSDAHHRRTRKPWAFHPRRRKKERGRSSTITIENEYNSAAKDYDRKWESYTRTSVSAAMERILPTLESVQQQDSSVKQPTIRLLDIGSGTGALAYEIHTRFPDWEIVCLDVSQEMLVQAQQKDWIHRENVSFVQGSSEALPFPDKSFHVVTTLSSFHFWNQPEHCLRDIRRVLKPQIGRFCMTDWCHDFVSCKLCSLWLRARGHPRESWTVFSLKQAQDLIEAAGFQLDYSEAYPIPLRMAKIGPHWGMMTIIASNPS